MPRIGPRERYLPVFVTEIDTRSASTWKRRAKSIQRVVSDLNSVGRPEADMQLPGFQTHDIEQVVDQSAHAPEEPFDALCVRAEPAWITLFDGASRNRVGAPRDAAEHVSQIVTCDTQKVVTRGDCFVCPTSLRGERVIGGETLLLEKRQKDRLVTRPLLLELLLGVLSHSRDDLVFRVPFAFDLCLDTLADAGSLHLAIGPLTGCLQRLICSIAG